MKPRVSAGRFSLCLLALVALLAAFASNVLVARQGQGMSKDERDICLKMLSDAKSDLEKNYYDRTFHGIDLAAHFAKARADVEAAQSVNQATDVIAQAFFTFDDSHTWFIPPPRATRVKYGWKMAMVGDQPLVIEVDPKSDAAKKGLTPGDRVVALNRFQPSRANLWQISYYYSAVRPQSQQRVVVRKPDGQQAAYDVNSETERRPVVQIQDAIEDWIEEDYRNWDVSKTVQPGILVWRMTEFREGEDIKPFITEARKAKSVVLDLRGNPGGYVDGLKSLVSWTFDKEVLVAAVKSRDKEKKEIVKPKGSFTGPMIVLVDSRSGSAAEMYARVVQLEKRATVIGDRTAGAVMGSIQFSHSYGFLEHQTFYGASITVFDVLMSDGKSLEKVGVTPDEVVVPTPQDLAAKRDPVLARAIAAAGGTITPEEAGVLFEKSGKK